MAGFYLSKKNFFLVLSKRTGIGIGVGAAIIAIGLYFLVSSFGLQTILVDDTYGIGESATYKFTAPNHAKQFFNITGSSFHVSLTTPEGGLQIPGRDLKNELSLHWVHLKDGESILKIQNTADSEMRVKGTMQAFLDPIQIIFRVLIIIPGIIIVGFSSAFSVRKSQINREKHTE